MELTTWNINVKVSLIYYIFLLNTRFLIEYFVIFNRHLDLLFIPDNQIECSKLTYHGGCIQHAELTIEKFLNHNSSPEKCYKLCTKYASCAGFHMNYKTNLTNECVLRKEGCNDDGNPNSFYFSKSDCE